MATNYGATSPFDFGNANITGVQRASGVTIPFNPSAPVPPANVSLSPEHRAKLDSIVHQMVQNGEKDQDIQFVVDDFKSKYANQPAAPARAEAKPEEDKSIGGFIGNVFKSGGRFLKDTAVGVGNAVFHPQRTLQSIGDPLVGLTAKVIGHGDDPAFAKETAQANAVGQFYKDRYGGIDQIKNTVYNDPVGFASDVSVLTGGAGKVFSKAGELSQLSSLTKTGNALAKVSDVTNPFQVATRAGSVAAKPLAPILESSAVKQYSEALGATTKENKFLSKQVVPGLLDKGEKAFTREGLLGNFKANRQAVGQAIGEAEKLIPENTPVQTKGVIKELDAYKSQFVDTTPQGKQIVLEPEKYAATKQLRDIIAEYGDTVPYKSMDKLKTVWSKTVAEGKGYLGKTFSEGSSLAVKDIATEAIRQELGKQFPDIGKLNRQYSFWKKAEKVLGDTLDRTRSQAGTSLGERIAQSTFGGAGLIKHGVEGAVLAGSAAKNAVKLFSSTAWRTTSATSKYRLATLIAEGKAAEASRFISDLLNAASTNQRRPAGTSQSPLGFPSPTPAQ